MPVTHYLWDPETDALLMETDGDGNTTVVYTQEPKPYGGLISQRRGGETYYHHYDGLGSTRQLTNASGQVTDEYLYTAFGELVAQSGTTENPFRWLGSVGYYFDAATGDYYVRARNYSPKQGRWTSFDPLLFVDGANLYVAYFVPPGADPSGEVEPVSVCFFVGAAVCLLLQGCSTGTSNPKYGQSVNQPKIDKALSLINDCYPSSRHEFKEGLDFFAKQIVDYDDESEVAPNVTLVGTKSRVNSQCTSHTAGDVAMALFAEYWRNDKSQKRGTKGGVLTFEQHDEELMLLHVCLCQMARDPSNTSANPRHKRTVRHEDPPDKTGVLMPGCDS